MDATDFFRMLVPTYRIIWSHVPGDHQNIDHPHFIEMEFKLIFGMFILGKCIKIEGTFSYRAVQIWALRIRC
jgi:hypothetical protein